MASNYLFKDDSSSESSSEDEEQIKKQELAFIPQKNPAETIFDMGVDNINDFLKKVSQFEQITNDQLRDAWRIKDLAFVPLEVRVDVQEYIPGLFDILKPDSQVPISKVLSTFCYLQIESINIKNEIEQKFFDPLIYFGESGGLYEIDRPEEETAGNMEIELSRCLPVFNEFLDTVRKLVAITKNILLQMNGLFNSKYPVFDQSFKKITYTSIFDNLGEMLTSLYIIDLIIIENTAFSDYWVQYNQMFAKVKSNMEHYNMTGKMLRKLQKFCGRLYNSIMNGKLFEEYLEGLKEAIRADLQETLFKNKTFQEKYLEYIEVKIKTVEAQLSAQMGPSIMVSQTEYMNLLINYSVYRKLFGIEDSKIYSKIWALQKLCPILVVYNNLYVVPGNFLAQLCPLKKKTKVDPENISLFIRAELEQREKIFPGMVQSYYNRLILWITTMNSDQLKDSDRMQVDKSFMKVRAQMIQTGIQLATEIKRTMKSFLLLVQENKSNLRKEMFPHIIKSIEMLKAIEVEYKTKKFLINKWVVLVNRFTCEQITRIIEQGVQNVYAMKKKDIQQNMMTLVTTVLECYKGGYNQLRKTVVSHCLNLCASTVFNQDQINEISSLNQRLNLVCNWEMNARRATRCRFIYWHRVLNPLFFNQILSDKYRLNQINYYLMALQDPLEMLQNIRHLSSPQVAIDNYKKDVYETFQKCVIFPICQKTEEDLRQQIHQILIPNMAQINPQRQPITNVQRWAQMNDLYLFEKKISIKSEIRDYLSHIFYEMSALSPHDFRTYEHMRMLCQDKLDIEVLPSHLPSSQLEQGVDIMVLLRETEKYTSNYFYNLHTQIFHERTTETKQLKTIGVNQMVYSIRKHGVGILSNVMNQLYKFVRRQISNFCKKFLLDESIRNLLFREAKIFNRDKDKLNGHYPYDKAYALSRTLRTLVEEVNYLETIRERITQIGNTLGFVRMIKNASLKDNQNLLKFIPSFLTEFKFEDIAEDLGIEGATMEAVKMFDESVRLMQKQGEDANDYLRNMVKNNEGFADKDEKYLPLKNFFMLVPAVSLAYVEHVVKGRTKLQKKNNTDAFISDDGFPLGCVFLLKILGVTEQFNTLNWFDSVQQKLSADQSKSEGLRNKTAKPVKGANVYEDDAVEEEISIKRIEGTKTEFSLLQFNIVASAILFKEI